MTVVLMALAGIADANPPNPADVEACNQEAAAAESGSVSASPTAMTAMQTDARETDSAVPRGSDVPQQHRVTPNGGSSAAARQAFAACLARHGYYKGYYHH